MERPINPFVYPRQVLERKHGPGGYETYGSFRPWLRDDCDFRCVYCLCRETWGSFKGAWDLDHIVRQADDPTLIYDYENLVYSCHRCNLSKRKDGCPTPFEVAYGECLSVNDNGMIVALNDVGRVIIEAIELDDPELDHIRGVYIKIAKACLLTATTELGKSLQEDSFGLPKNLPNLSLLHAENSLPEGLKRMWYLNKERWHFEIEPPKPFADAVDPSESGE